MRFKKNCEFRDIKKLTPSKVSAVLKNVSNGFRDIKKLTPSKDISEFWDKREGKFVFRDIKKLTPSKGNYLDMVDMQDL